MHVTARKAASVDASTLALMRWRWHLERRGEPAACESTFLQSMTAWVVDHMSSHVPFVAEVDGRVAAMAWLALSERVPSPGSADRRTGDLQAVYVLPELRSSGVGPVLLEAVFVYARQLRLERITVHSSERAVPFYLRHGFDEDNWFEKTP
jgi:GNAT superfamily N-acetyltransferase